MVPRSRRPLGERTGGGVGVDVVMMERDGEHGGAFWGEEFPLMVARAFG